MILTGQFEAALCMMGHSFRACPPEHWEGKIANRTEGDSPIFRRRLGKIGTGPDGFVIVVRRQSG